MNENIINAIFVLFLILVFNNFSIYYIMFNNIMKFERRQTEINIKINNIEAEIEKIKREVKNNKRN